jgi:hypothetical protein
VARRSCEDFGRVRQNLHEVGVVLAAEEQHCPETSLSPNVRWFTIHRKICSKTENTRFGVIDF